MFSAKSRSSGFFQAAGLSVVAGVCGSFHVLAATGVPTTAAPLVQPSYFESEDIFGLEWASDPQLSPDGRTIVYVRNSNDIMTDRARTALWQIDVASGQHTPLYADKFNYSQPRWAPDGSRLAFISDQSGKAQVHLHWVKTGQNTQLSRLDKGPSNLTWSPDGKQLAFTMNLPATPSKLTTLVKMPKKPKDANWSEPVIVIDRAQYQADGQGFLKSESAALKLILQPLLQLLRGLPQLSKRRYNGKLPVLLLTVLPCKSIWLKSLLSAVKLADVVQASCRAMPAAVLCNNTVAQRM